MHVRVCGKTQLRLIACVDLNIRQQVVWQITPRATCFAYREDGVRDCVQGGMSACFGLIAVEGVLEDGLQDSPFCRLDPFHKVFVEWSP
jgi:hypothetical protein